MRCLNSGDPSATSSTAFMLGVALVVVVLGNGMPARGAVEHILSGAKPPAEEPAAVDVRLTTHGPSVAEMVDAARRHAAMTPGAVPNAPITLVLTSDLAREVDDHRQFLAGQQQARFAYVRVGLAWAERTTLHELAHVLAPGDGHDEIWRAVYLGAIADLYGDDRAAREHRRIAWVYDRCYATDTCPKIRLPER